ncbi:MAG TPA: SBBP repeat-containing protein, partial [Bacteroidia bacterium]|nr:SBBP repeat-containing protein [Bacteroidia bacterium]
DAYGNVYLAGSTGSSTGISSNGFQNSIGGSTDAFLVKFDWAGTRQWATYYGGSAADEGYSVATDNNGNVFLGGFTYSTSGIASGGFQNTHGGGSIDAFLVKFDSAGIRIWATYYGGPGDEMVLFAGDIGVATDSGNNVYLAGLTNSTTGIAANGYQNTIGGNYDAFLVKFESSGGRLWATYYGGTADDKAYQVATRPGNDVLICGRTGSNTNIAAGGFYNNYGGNNDAFLVKFNTNGLRQCGTYYGGSGIDDCNSIAVDAYGNVYLAGGTENTASIASGGFQNSYGGGSFDAMLVKFTAGCMTTGNTELDSIALSVYPNPSDGLLTIEQQTIGFVSVEVYNQFGQLLLVTSFTDRRRKIDLSGWGNGIYFLRIIKNGEVITQHVIIN